MMHPGAPVEFPSLAQFAGSGVYFLYLRGEIVYVGQGVDMRRRIGQHITEGLKAFDAVSAFRCSRADLARYERFFIEKYAPKYNQCRLAHSVRSADAPRRPSLRRLKQSQRPVRAA